MNLNNNYTTRSRITYGLKAISQRIVAHRHPQKRSNARLRSTALTLLLLTLFSFVTVAPSALAETGLSAGSPARVANTDGDGVRLRESPNTGDNIIQTIDENELVMIRGGLTKDKQGNSFYKIEYNGKTGYAMAQYLIFAGKTTKGVTPLAVGSPGKIVNTDGDGVNMRQQANSGASVLNVLPEGALFTVMGGPFADKQGNNFYRVDFNGQAGYVTIAYVGSAPKNTVVNGGGNVRVTNTDGDPVRFRTGPGRNFDPNGFVYEGQVLKVLSNPVKDDSGNKWYRVERNGEVGFVDASFLAKTSDAVASAPAVSPAKSAPAAKPKAPVIQPPPSNGSLGDRIVTYAKQFLGWRYVWAGKSPAAGGFDCSGLVWWVLKQFGIQAGASSFDDVNLGVAVPLNAIQPGDILIWANTYTAGPSHVGIYIGGGKFIHAETESTGVTITNMSDEFYATRFYAARRVGV